MSAAPLVAFRGVEKRFGQKRVLQGVDLDVGRDETVAIIGASGGGKTVLIKSLVGLTRVDDGVVCFDGIELQRADERTLAGVRARIGFIFQAAALFDSLSVADNVGYPLRIRGVDRAAIAARVEECLALVDLAGTGPLLPGELSGGMRKRVAIARALATRPELLLYDEPTAGLDPANVHRIAALISSLQKLHATGLVVTHDRELALAVADRIALLAAGRIAWIGSNAEARGEPPILRAFWGTPPAEARR
jgi:phospholipid/cholesterol/gamma-HCH transport system ATP-binding protein